MSLPHRIPRICIRHSGLDPLFCGSWSDLPYHDPDLSTNTSKAVAISFSHTGLRGGVWYLVNIVNAWMSLDNLLTGNTNIGGDIFDPWSYCVSGLFSCAFKSASSIRHPSSYIPHLHWSIFIWIPLRYGVISGYILETYTEKPCNFSNVLWFNTSPFRASSLRHYTWCRVFPHFHPSTQVNNSLCWDVIIDPDHGPGVLLGSLIFHVTSWIPRYVQYVEILCPTTHSSSSENSMLLMS